MAVGNHKVEITVGVKDLASKALGNITKSVQGMARDINKAGTFMSSFNRNLDSTIAKLDKMGNSMYKFNMYTSSLQRNLRNIGTVGAVAAGGVAYQGMNNALQFDYKTHQMQARMETTAPVRKELEEYILKDLNLKVGFSPTELADMGVTLGQAGISNVSDMKAMMKTTSYFSEAVNAVPEQAAEMIIAASKGFGISMEDSSQITDKLTVALNKSLLGIDEMPHALGELAGRAKMYGQSLDSSLTALMTMRDAGMHAAQGSQDLLHALRQGSRVGNDQVLYDTTKGYFDSLGINDNIFNTDTRQLKEYPEIIAALEKSMIAQGFTNNKYGIKSYDDYQNYLAQNGGMPDDFWDSMGAMPLITKVFGAAGQAPILMGLQSKYEEINKETGEKTGNVYYGAEAVKRRYEEVKNSDGAVDATHEIMAQSGAYQLEILKGAWEATQIGFLDNMVPVISAGAKELTAFLAGEPNSYTPEEREEMKKNGQTPPTRLQNFRNAVEMAAQNYEEEGNTAGAELVRTIGNGIINGVQVSTTFPSLFGDIKDAFMENIVGADWGSNIVEFPIKLVENGIKFINDLLDGNAAFEEAVGKLPENLQDPAKLVETLAKGGIILLVSGAIVKVIELGVRGVSAALKGTKIAVDLATTIAKWITGSATGEGGKLPGGGKGAMAITANIVNVYGKAINDGGPGGGKSSGKGGNTTITGAPDVDGNGKTTGKKTSTGKKIVGGAATVAGSLVVGDVLSGLLGGHSYVKDGMESKYNPLNPNTEKKIDRMHELIVQKDTSSIPKNTEIKANNTFMDKVKDFFTPKYYQQKPAVDLSKWQQPSESISKLNSAIERLIIANNPSKNTNSQPGPRVENLPVEKITGPITNVLNTTSATLDTKTTNMGASIISGFNTANQRLQNLKLQNQVNVSMPAAQVSISGNIKEHISSVKVSPIQQSFTQSNSGGGGGGGASRSSSGGNPISTILARRSNL